LEAKAEREVLADCHELKVRLARTEASLMLLVGQEVDPVLFDMLANGVTKALQQLKRSDALAHRLQQAL